MGDGPGVVRRDDGEGVVVLVLTNPPVNALGRPVLDALEGHLAALEPDPAVRSVVVTGDGAYFSAGADVKEIATIRPEAAPAVVARGQQIFDRIERLPAPVVAAVNGLAVGGGLELALACDLRVVGDAAKLGAPEVTLGLLPAYGGTQRLPRLVGAARAREMIFTGHLVPAAEALRLGLANKVVPSGQELRAARDLAHTIAQRAPKAVRAAKRAIREGLALPQDQGLALERELFLRELLPSADLAEGVRAFLEHRPPKFTGT